MYTKYKKVYSWIKHYGISKAKNGEDLLTITTEQDNVFNTFHYEPEHISMLEDHYKNNTLCEFLMTERADGTKWIRL